MTEVRAVALTPAKINLGLEVTGRREDGFHEIVSILQTVTLFDRFEWKSDGNAFRYQSPRDIGETVDLVARALATANAMHRRAGLLTVRKQIPRSAGLGGGSSDAALALRLAHPEIPVDDLERLAAEFGSDVPFFVQGGTALVSGTGTTIERLPTPQLWFVVVTPPIVIPSKTSTLYGSLTVDDFTNGSAVRLVERSIRAGRPLEASPPNAFTRHIVAFAPVRFAWDALERAGAPWVSVSGAGPSVYSAVPDYRRAVAIGSRIAPGAGTVNVVRSTPHQHRHPSAENMVILMRRAARAR